MTTSIARSGGRTSAPTAATRAGAPRFGASLVSFGSIVLDAIEAARGVGSAHSTADRRAVLDRFAADTTRDAGRSAA